MESDSILAKTPALVYVVDDELTIRKILHKLLVKLGYEVHAFASASDAVIACQETPPDLLITDILMPEMNGVELIEAIQPILPNLPVICLSGYATKTTRQTLTKLHIKDFLEKPIKLEVLRDSVEKIFNPVANLTGKLDKGGVEVGIDDTDSGVRILLVDDNESFVDFEREALQLEGYIVDVCYRGDEALERFILRQYDIIILDMMMPGMDGLQVLKQIKEHDRLQPVIMITGEATGEMIDNCESITGERCLRKPIDIKDLVASIKGYDAKLLVEDRDLRRQRLLQKVSHKMSIEDKASYQRSWSHHHHAAYSTSRRQISPIVLVCIIAVVSLLTAIGVMYISNPSNFSGPKKIRINKSSKNIYDSDTVKMLDDAGVLEEAKKYYRQNQGR